MIVKQMMAILANFPDDAELHFCYNYGDHSRTEVAPKVADVTEGRVRFSEYHQLPVVIDEESDEDFDDEKLVILIQS